MQPIIEVKNLSVIYETGKQNEARALENVSAEIYPGEYVIFYGPSGCGKSTLLYAISGLEYITSGEIFIGGRKIGQLSTTELEAFHLTQIGMVFQAYYLIQSLSVLDNVALPQMFKRVVKTGREAQAMKLLEKFGVHEFADRLPKQLSGGQQQRVAIARALVNDPPILMADEPTGNLDSKSAINVLELLYNLNENEKRTIVLVTHDPAHLGFAHRVFHMKDGHITKVVRNEHRRLVIEQLKKQEKPERSADETAAESRFLVEYLTNPYSHTTILALERALNERIQGQLTRAAFRDFLSKPESAGGVGLSGDRAETLTERLEKILTERALISEQKVQALDNKTNLDDPAEVQGRYVMRTVLKGFHGSLDIPEQTRLQRFINLFSSGKINLEKLIYYLRLSLSGGGVGLPLHSARYVAEQVDVLLTKPR